MYAVDYKDRGSWGCRQCHTEFACKEQAEACCRSSTPKEYLNVFMDTEFTGLVPGTE